MIVFIMRYLLKLEILQATTSGLVLQGILNLFLHKYSEHKKYYMCIQSLHTIVRNSFS